jgi:hypothetical protein
MNPKKAARKYVQRTLNDTLKDFLTLTVPGGDTRPYLERVEKAVRKKLGAPKERLADLEDAVEQSVPAEHRGAVHDAVMALSDAVTQEFGVREETAYLIGIEVGRAVSMQSASER